MPSFLDNIITKSTIEFETENSLASAALYIMRPCRAVYGRKIVHLAQLFTVPIQPEQSPQNVRVRIEAVAANQRAPWVQKALKVVAFGPAVIGVTLLAVSQISDPSFKARFKLVTDAIESYHLLFNSASKTDFASFLNALDTIFNSASKTDFASFLNALDTHKIFTREQILEMVERRLDEIIPSLEWNRCPYLLFDLIGALQNQFLNGYLFSSEEAMYSFVLNAIDKFDRHQQRALVDRDFHMTIWFDKEVQGQLPKFWEYKILHHLNYKGDDIIQRYTNLLTESGSRFKRLEHRFQYANHNSHIDRVQETKFASLQELTILQKAQIYKEMDGELFKQFIEQRPLLLLKVLQLLTQKRCEQFFAQLQITESNMELLTLIKNMRTNTREIFYRCINPTAFISMRQFYPALLLEDFELLTEVRQKILMKNLDISFLTYTEFNACLNLGIAIEKVETEPYLQICRLLGHDRLVRLAANYNYNYVIRKELIMNEEFYDLISPASFDLLCQFFSGYIVEDFNLLSKALQKRFIDQFNIEQHTSYGSEIRRANHMRSLYPERFPEYTKEKGQEINRRTNLSLALGKVDRDTHLKIFNLLGHDRVLVLTGHYGFSQITKGDYQIIKSVITNMNRSELDFFSYDGSLRFFGQRETGLCAWNILLFESEVYAKLSLDEISRLMNAQTMTHYFKSLEVEDLLNNELRIVNFEEKLLLAVDSLVHAPHDVVKAYFDGLKQTIMFSFNSYIKLQDAIEKGNQWFSGEACINFIELAKKHPDYWAKGYRKSAEQQIILNNDPLNKCEGPLHMYMHQYLDLFTYSLLVDVDLFVRVYRYVLTAQERVMVKTLLKDWMKMSLLYGFGDRFRDKSIWPGLKNDDPLIQKLDPSTWNLEDEFADESNEFTRQRISMLKVLEEGLKIVKGEQKFESVKAVEKKPDSIVSVDGHSPLLFEACIMEILKKPNFIEELQNLTETTFSIMEPYFEREIERRMTNLTLNSQQGEALKRKLAEFKKDHLINVPNARYKTEYESKVP